MDAADSQTPKGSTSSRNWSRGKGRGKPERGKGTIIRAGQNELSRGPHVLRAKECAEAAGDATFQGAGGRYQGE